VGDTFKIKQSADMTPKEKQQLVAEGKQMDLRYRGVWNNLIKSTDSIGWKDVMYLVLKFQEHMDSNYKLTEKLNP
jgi:hypothetical protein